MVGLSRRRFLGAAGVLVSALLTGCGRDEARKRPPADAEVIAGLLRRETAVWEAVRGSDAAIARQDREHVERLEAVAGAVGSGQPPLPALAAKQQAVFAYVAALPELDDPGLRVLVMQIAASEAEHLAALRLARGSDPVPDAFAGYAEALR